MAVTVADFRLRFPEFNTPIASDPQIQLVLDDVILELNAGVWGQYYNLGICYLSAHYLADYLRKSSASVAGPMTGKTAGSVSSNYALVGGNNATLIDGDLASTKYGRRYMRYLEIVTGGTPVVIAC